MEKKIIALTLAAATLALPYTYAATTLDFRHEYADSTRIHKDRIAIIQSLDNGVSFYVDASVKSGGVNNEQDKFLSDLVTNAIEMGLSYNYKIDQNISLQPGIIFESGNDNAIYKPYLRAQYSFDNGLYLAGRYRYDYARKTQDGSNDETTNRLDGYIGYRFADARLEYNYTQMYSDALKYNNKKTNYEHNVAFAYKINQTFTPYIEVGNVAVNKNSDARQTRYRVGLQYNF
ncbi:hypothetical protein I6G97_07930 [Edwardsiella hoshinae]|uniref:Oligogalacturonate-specific porin kdgM n=1 Tax=Edwardsiella hoshinae TaxID=93378 RepID=A0A376DJX5_9GAMM|nr:oligogalacturonate-specific porin KdgM family protein [Edwardsiella hoshinae]QPR29479.1 hypothetical protein I6G97_07930 [Edwardsiella hoshinae]STC90364.1 Oligogalacturonate-specific porin kdgM precursor [Edwardsiella hoshinae]